MYHFGINLAYVLWALAILICVTSFRKWRKKQRERRFIPRIRYHRETRKNQPKTHAGFFACPDCGLLAEEPCDCPECSLVKPVRMIPGDPKALELYLQRQTIFYGLPLD